VTERTEGTDLPPLEAEFARARDTPGHTRYQLPDTDVNAVLAARAARRPSPGTCCGTWRHARPPAPAATSPTWSSEQRPVLEPHRGGGGGYLDRCSMRGAGNNGPVSAAMRIRRVSTLAGWPDRTAVITAARRASRCPVSAGSRCGGGS
jgi:hypothetical protein